MQSEEPREYEPTPEEQKALLHAGSTPVPAASASAREAARTAFLEGKQTTIHRPGPNREAGRGAAPTHNVRARFLGIGGLAAAAAVAGLFWFGNHPVDEWRVVQVAEAGAAMIDGEAARIGDAFLTGTVEAGGESMVHCQLGDRIRVVLAPGSEARLPAGPGRWLGGQRSLFVDEGEIFASSGERRLGFDLIVRTPEARVHIVGTTFAVRRNEAGTCICLWEGAVDVEPSDGGATVEVPRGQRLQVYADGRPPKVESLTPDEETMLAAMHETGIARQD